jgi:hypothetical protein
VLAGSLLQAPVVGSAARLALGGEAVPKCEPSQLDASLPAAGPKTAGTMMQGAVVALWVTNQGGACAIKGYPVLSALISAGGKDLIFVQVDSTRTVAGGPYADRPVLLRHGSTAASLIAYAGGSLPAQCAHWLVVGPLQHSLTTRLTLRQGVRICPGAYRTHELQVTPYHPSSVGPFSHWP